MILYHAHAGLRYVVLLAGVAALLYALQGLLRRRPYDRAMRGLGSAFTGLLHLQILLGLALLFTGRFYPALSGHILLMILAAAAAQTVSSVMRRRPPAERSFGPHLVGTAVALALIVAGVLAVPGASILGTRGP